MFRSFAVEHVCWKAGLAFELFALGIASARIISHGHEPFAVALACYCLCRLHSRYCSMFAGLRCSCRLILSGNIKYVQTFASYFLSALLKVRVAGRRSI